jgi:DNA-binding transcriptional ArsR family regulator
MARPSRFSPRSENLDALEARTVSREDTCATMVSTTVASVTSGQARFDLVLGPRGAGKSHLLGLVEGRLRKALAGKAIIAALPEELHPSSLVHVLAEILRALPEDPEVGPLARQLAILADCAPTDAMDRAVGMTRARLRGLPLVIIIENLDVVFAAIGRQGQHQLRSILQTERSWSIVATSRSLSPAFSKESEPFYGTFVPRTLEPLSAEACREQLVRLARANGREALARELDTPLGLARVQTLRHVLGSYPRAMAFVFPHLHHDEPEMVERALHELAEELTPYFQEQMGRLSTGQRPIAELLAEHWTPLSVGEIARATFTPPASTSTHLKYLREDAIVRSTKLGREQYYELADPMFRIARAMKRNEIRAKTFLRVLQGWYELRGVDFWRLPAEVQIDIRKLDFDGIESRYTKERLLPLLRKLQRRQYRKVLDDLAKLDVHQPLFAALRVVALCYSGAEEEAFAEISAAERSKTAALITSIWSIEAALAGNEDLLTVLAAGQGSSIGRVAMATLAVEVALEKGQRDDLPTIVATLEQALGSKVPSIRRSVTEIVVELSVPFCLARAGEYELCGRLLDGLSPIASSAMSINLANVALRAWAADRIPDVFRRGPEGVLALSRELDGWVRLGLLLLVDAKELPTNALNELGTALSESLARTKENGNQQTLSQALWFTVFIVAMPRRLPQLRGAMQSLPLAPPEALHRWASLLHIGILYWIAAGKDLTPIASVASLHNEMFGSLGVAPTLVESTNPDVAYVRLPSAERAIVRQLAASLGLEERHAALCKLANDET